MVRPMRFLHSLQARYTTAATTLLFLITALGGVSLDLAVRYRIEDRVFFDAEQVAARWSAQVRSGTLPHPASVSGAIHLVQLVDARGRILVASPDAAGRPRLSMLRPPADDRLQRRVECAPGRPCLLLMANRVSLLPPMPPSSTPGRSSRPCAGRTASNTSSEGPGSSSSCRAPA